MDGAIDFTIKYINILKSSLRISITDDGPLFLPDSISKLDIDKLMRRLDGLWKKSRKAIESIQYRNDALLQSCFYGFSGDFDLSLKVGYMLGERVVYWDLLYRNLNRKKDSIDKEYLGYVATNLISAFGLAEQGLFVILPHPLQWSICAKEAYASFAEILPPHNKALRMIPSIVASFDLGLQPYTVSESEDEYIRILKETTNLFNGYRELRKEVYGDSIIAGLNASRILNEQDFVQILDIPINNLHKVISSQSDFYRDLRYELTSGGELMYEHNYRELLKKIRGVYQEHNIIGKNAATHITTGAGVAGIISLFNPKFAFASAAMRLIGSILAYSKSSNRNENVVTAVFCKLSKLIE